MSCGRCRALDLVVAEKDKEITAIKAELDSRKDYFEKMQERGATIDVLRLENIGLNAENARLTLVVEKPKVTREEALSAVRKACMNCGGEGFTVYETGGCGPDGENDTRESCQEQCQWCYTSAEEATDAIMKLLEGKV